MSFKAEQEKPVRGDKNEDVGKKGRSSGKGGVSLGERRGHSGGGE